MKWNCSNPRTSQCEEEDFETVLHLLVGATREQCVREELHGFASAPPAPSTQAEAETAMVSISSAAIEAFMRMYTSA
jgi:hypothetical protein